MKQVKIIFLFTILLFLTSCDPVHTLTVYNTSGRERQIQVIGIQRDSISVQQLESNGKLGKAKMIPVESKDERKLGFTFSLQPTQKANLEFGFGRKPATDRIIIDGKDTIHVAKSTGKVINKPFYAIGGNYQLTIKD